MASARRHPGLLLLVALIAAHLGSPPASGVDDPVAAAEAAWEEEMRQLAAEGDEEAALELGRIAVDKGDPEGAQRWLRRAEELGAEVPPDLEQAAASAGPASRAGGGWGSGSVERRAVGAAAAPRPSDDPCDRPGVDLDLALRRADLALANQDLERWIDAIVPLVRAGCRSPALVERIEKARAAEESLQAARDREIASAVRKGRPTVGTQVGRPLGSGSSNAGAWAEVVNGLIGVLEARRGSVPSSVDRRVPDASDSSTRNAYAGIWADTQDQIERDPAGNRWDQAAAQVKRVTQRGQVGDLPEPEVTDEAGTATPAPSAASPGLNPAGGSGLTTGDNCQPAYASLCPAERKRPGSVCYCCQDFYGLPGQCYWHGGQAPRPSPTGSVPSSVDHRVPDVGDSSTRKAHAGIWADTQDQIERDPAANRWDQANALIKRGPTRRGQVDTPPATVEPPPTSSPGTGAGGPVSGSSSGSELSGSECRTVPDSECLEAVGPGAGQCICCDVLFGLPHCGWEGGAPRQSGQLAAAAPELPRCVYAPHIQADLRRMERGARLPGPPGMIEGSEHYTWWIIRGENSDGQLVFDHVRSAGTKDGSQSETPRCCSGQIISPAFPGQPWEAWQFLTNQVAACR